MNEMWILNIYLEPGSNRTDDCHLLLRTLTYIIWTLQQSATKWTLLQSSPFAWGERLSCQQFKTDKWEMEVISCDL